MFKSTKVPNKKTSPSEKYVERRFLNRFKEAYNFSEESKSPTSLGKKRCLSGGTSGTISKTWAKADANPILQEIVTRLKEPQNIEKLLNKTLIALPSNKFYDERQIRLRQSQGMYATIPNDSGLSMTQKPIKIKQAAIEKSLN